MRAQRTWSGVAIRGRWLAALTSLSLAGLPAAAQADANWTGTSTSPNWAEGANWTGTAPTANTSVGTLTFPPLSCAAPSTCYVSTNDLTGVSAAGLVFGNAAGSYQIHEANAQDTLAVGSGGISTTAGHGGGTTIHTPFDLNASQDWTIGSSTNGYDALTVLGPVADDNPADALSIFLTDGDLYADTDIEVGPVTVNGPGTIHIGRASGNGKLNATDGQPVTLEGARMIANPNSTVGRLSTSGGTLLLGTGSSNVAPATLQVGSSSPNSSAATIGATGTPTSFQTLINDNGSTPGTDFSQMTANGDISLANASLNLGQGPGATGQCVPLNRGDVATLLQTTGSLTGTFTNVANGAQLTVTPRGPCTGTSAVVQINYTAHSVTATVVSGSAPAPPPSPAPPPAGAPAPPPAGAPAPPQPGAHHRTPGRLLELGDRREVFGRTVRLRLKCESHALCRGRFTLIARVRVMKHRRPRIAALRCASVGFRIRADHVVNRRVRLSAGCVRRLRLARHHRLVVMYISRVDTGQRGQRRRIMLTLAGHKQRGG